MKKIQHLISVTLLTTKSSVCTKYYLGNPIDSLPKININKDKKPAIEISKEASPLEKVKEIMCI